MTLFNHNVALILYDVEDYLSTLKHSGGGGGGGGGVSWIRGKQTGSDVDAILKKIEDFKVKFPDFELQLRKLKKKNEGDYSGGGSSGGSGGGSGGGRRDSPAPKVPAKRPPTPQSGDEEIYEVLPGFELENASPSLQVPNATDSLRSSPVPPQRNNRQLNSVDSYVYASDYPSKGDIEATHWDDIPAADAQTAALFSGICNYRTESQGSLYKQKASTFGKSFKPRFCVLRDGHLLVYEKATAAKPKEVIDLSTCRVEATSSDKYSFKVLGICKDHEFNADNEENKRKWMEKITTMTQALKTDTIEPVSSTDDEESGSEESLTADTSVNAPRIGKYDNDKAGTKGKKEEVDDVVEGDLDLSNPLYTCAYVCKWDFKGFKPQQVSATRGEIVDLLNKDYETFGWWTVQSTKGKVGLMPKKWLTPAYEKILVD